MTGLPSLARSEPPVVVSDRERAFVVSFGQTVRACSWAIVNGGFVETPHVVWLEVHNAELGPAVEPRAFVVARLRRERLPKAVALLTSRRISSRVDVTAEEAGVAVRAIATVGLGNALRAGDAPWTCSPVGTINVLVHVAAPLTDEGLLEASAMATEAKAAALFDAGVTSRRSGKLATGTGTDCTVATCLLPRRDLPGAAYAGKYTAVGAAVGSAVERAVAAGVREWQKDVGA